MPKVSIEVKQILSVHLPEGSKIVCISDDTECVTWYRKVDKNQIELSTCRITEFECQNDTDSIFLTKEEFFAIEMMVLKDMKW
jgi:hypothetical protein